MPAVKPDEGRVQELTDILAAVAANLRVRLYKNNYTPVAGSTAGSFTDADFSGYAQQTPAFAGPAIDANGNAHASAATLTYTHNGGATANSVYGYYVIDTGSGKVFFGERFAGAPLSFAINGDSVQITPNWYDGVVSPPY